MIQKILFILLSLSGTTYLWAAPAQVVVIRHAEKPDPEGNELSPQGWKRAYALPRFFEVNAVVNQFGKAVAIYSASPNKDGGSIRSIQTVTPLADLLKVTINTSFHKDDLDELVQEIMNTSAYDGKMVLICWEHKIIPTMIEKFGYGLAPKKWAGESFDRAWVLNFKGNQVTSFQNLPENVLPDDSH